MSSEELRQVRDTLIEELRRSETLTVAGRALFARYAAMSDAATGAVAPEAAPGPPPVARRRPEPVEEEDEFGGSFMVRNNPSQPNIPGYRETPPPEQPSPVDLPRSLRHRRR
ncbi:hypothetical protein [Actinophytocola oryzae]|uniref:Uncharacterized protein n=1 Tax=Actinophytocola oryzae TaxID=502181 RepID=A0A4R7UVI7_9PSEU|nr:hypothetical protein [Actinophytocola oryzae]TDV40729.1 hypothetical protein CLV71_122119 [Actinophytocola oryzae]